MYISWLIQMKFKLQICMANCIDSFDPHLQLTEKSTNPDGNYNYY